VATVREGLETALFLLSAETDAASGVEVVVGGLIGLAAAALLGWIVYRGGSRLDLRRFFQITGILLILFAAGLVGKSVHEFREALGFETGGVVNAAWTIRSGPWADGTFYDFLKGFFGWHAETEWIRLIAYVGYLAPVLWLFLWAPSPSPSERSASGRTAVEA
jgi:high-affinity iron transporter